MKCNRSRIASCLGVLAALVLAASVTWAENFPDSWFLGQKIDRIRHQQMVGKKAPSLSIGKWLTKSAKLEDLKGKVVLIDFWATWCGPCMKALPHNNDLLKEFGEKGLEIIAIHDGTKGSESAPDVVSKLGIEYPLGVDAGTKSARAWRVGFWPTYALIDRKGLVRAVGLNPNYVESAIKKIIDEPYEPETETESPDKTAPENAESGSTSEPSAVAANDPKWLEGTADKRLRLAALEKNPTPPALKVEDWRQSEPLALEGLKGKVVLLNFWAVWCPHCKTAIAKLNQLRSKYGDEGLVVIGVTQNSKLDELEDVMQKRVVSYPICVDMTGATFQSYNVDGYPDFYFIDRAGRLRVADANFDSLDEIARTLLDEPAPAS